AGPPQQLKFRQRPSLPMSVRSEFAVWTNSRAIVKIIARRERDAVRTQRLWVLPEREPEPCRRPRDRPAECEHFLAPGLTPSLSGAGSCSAMQSVSRV